MMSVPWELYRSSNMQTIDKVFRNL